MSCSGRICATNWRANVTLATSPAPAPAKNSAVTFSRQDADGRALNPSSLIAHLQALFPGLKREEFQPDTDWRKAEHVNELVAPLVRICGSPAMRDQSAPSSGIVSQSRLTSAATEIGPNCSNCLSWRV